MFTSSLLIPGSIYTRNQLIETFSITDSNVKNGVFRPRGYDSIWLFITEEKSSDITQYQDSLIGDELRWQGQTMGRTDRLVIEHERNGMEILVFYRHSKTQYPDFGFRYEGLFEYQSHAGERPTSFILRRMILPPDILLVQNQIENTEEFQPTNVEDERSKTLANIVRRRGQAAFRSALMSAYEECCAITGCSVRHVLEAAHIVPYQGKRTNHVQNGLLLRADVHTLFDLRLLSFDPSSMTVEVAPQLRSSEYGRFHGMPLRLPKIESLFPSNEALRMHRASCNF